MLKSRKSHRQKSHFLPHSFRRKKRLYPKLPRKKKNQRKAKLYQDWREIPILQSMLFDPDLIEP